MNEPNKKSSSNATRRPLSRNENVDPCDDPCCCCEPEPRWIELGRELGLDTDGPPRLPDRSG